MSKMLLTIRQYTPEILYALERGGGDLVSAHCDELHRSIEHTLSDALTMSGPGDWAYEIARAVESGDKTAINKCLAAAISCNEETTEMIGSVAISTRAKKAGAAKSKNKMTSSKKNGASQKPHFKKCSFFEKIFPHELISNEHKHKINLGYLTKTGRPATYNPDYWCEDLQCYIEVATSRPNISEQGDKWATALRAGHPLKIYWWEGNEITNEIFSKSKMGALF